MGSGSGQSGGTQVDTRWKASWRTSGAGPMATQSSLSWITFMLSTCA